MRPLTAEQWRQFSPFLDRALSMTESDRAVWLKSMAESDPTLAAGLGQLFESYRALQDQAFLEGRPARPDVNPVLAGQRLGAYRLVSLIGQGGMGSVWLAERDDGKFNRQVAVKFLHFLTRSSGASGRFEREGKILGQLSHSNIAALLDAGVAPDSLHYLVLEYVEGLPIDQYCDQHKLDIEHRVQLFLDVLSGVAHAHANLVVHRDIKSSNVIVRHDGVVKLLDFGIAKLLSDENSASTAFTLDGSGPLTPQLAAPEQIRGNAITTATDIYALGLLLYLLLTGEHAHGSLQQSFESLVYVIVERDPVPLSRCIPPERASLAAEQRSTTPDRLRRIISEDLERIVAKALKKNPAERYPTAVSFAEDLRRYLQDGPVSVRSDSFFYRSVKFVRRNKLPVLGAAAIFAALMLGLSLTLWQARVARRQARTAAAVEQFTEDIFRMNNRNHPNPEQAQHTTARQLLDMGALEASSSLNDQPDAKLKMLDLLGSLYQDLEVSDQAVAIREQKVALVKRMYGAQSPKIVSSLIDLGRSMHSSRSVNERESILLEAQTILNREGDFTSKTRGELLSALAENYTSSDVFKAAQLAAEAIAILRRWPGSPELAQALRTAGYAYISTGRFADAESSMSEAIDLSKRLNGDPNVELPQYYATKGQAQLSLMKYAEAEDSYRQSYRYAKLLAGDNDVDTFMTEGRLGMLLVLTSRSREALPYLSDALNSCLLIKGPDDPFFTPQMEMQYGNGLEAAGRLEDAVTHISKAIANRRANRPGTAYLAAMLEDQAEVLVELGRFADAENALREDETIRQKVKAKANDAYFRPRVRLALEQNRLDDLQELINRFNIQTASSGAKLTISEVRGYYAKTELALSKHDAATALAFSRELRKRLADAGMQGYLRLWHIRTVVWECRAHLQDHRPDLAIPLLTEAIQAQTAMFDTNSPELAASEALLGSAFLQTGNPSRARHWLASSTSRLKHHAELCPSYRREADSLARNLSFANN